MAQEASTLATWMNLSLFTVKSKMMKVLYVSLTLDLLAQTNKPIPLALPILINALRYLKTLNTITQDRIVRGRIKSMANLQALNLFKIGQFHLSPAMMALVCPKSEVVLSVLTEATPS